MPKVWLGLVTGLAEIGSSQRSLLHTDLDLSLGLVLLDSRSWEPFPSSRERFLLILNRIRSLLSFGLVVLAYTLEWDWDQHLSCTTLHMRLTYSFLHSQWFWQVVPGRGLGPLDAWGNFGHLWSLLSNYHEGAMMETLDFSNETSDIARLGPVWVVLISSFFRSNTLL